jgi:hypothetical protein
MDLPVSTLTSNALNLKAPIASPAFTGQITMPRGTAGTPSLSITGDTNSGLYQSADDNIEISTGGVMRVNVSNTGIYCQDIRVNSGIDGHLAFFQTATKYLSSKDPMDLPVSTLTSNALNLKAPIASPVFTGVVSVPLGSVTNPSITFTGDTDTGIYSSGTNSLNFTTNGVQKLNISTSTITASAPLSSNSNITTTALITAPTFLVSSNGALTSPAVNQISLEVGSLPTSPILNIRSTGILNCVVGSAASPSYSFLNDNDTGIYNTTNTINFTCGGTQECLIDTNGFKNSLGSVINPSYSFIGDTDTGLYSSTAGDIDYTSNGTAILKMNTTAITGYVPLRLSSGTVSNPTYSFSLDTDTGIYSSSANNIDFCTNSINRLNIGTTSATINLKTKFTTNTIDSYINSSTGNTIFSTPSLTNKYISNTVYATADTDQWTVFESNATPNALSTDASAFCQNGNTTIVINPGDNSTLWWLDEDFMTTANNYAWTGWRISTAGVITTSSDRRLKKDIYKIDKENILNHLVDIDIVKYKRKAPSEDKNYKNGNIRKKYTEEHMGVIAQNVQKHFEDVVETQSDDDKTLSVKYQDLTYYFHIGTQELIQKVKRLEEENKRLKTDIEKIQIFLNNRFNFT